VPWPTDEPRELAWSAETMSERMGLYGRDGVPNERKGKADLRMAKEQVASSRCVRIGMLNVRMVIEQEASSPNDQC
jgi:hypothetical protein